MAFKNNYWQNVEMWSRESINVQSHCTFQAFADDPLTYLCWVVDWLISLNEDIAFVFRYQDLGCLPDIGGALCHQHKVGGFSTMLRQL